MCGHISKSLGPVYPVESLESRTGLDMPSTYPLPVLSSSCLFWGSLTPTLIHLVRARKYLDFSLRCTNVSGIERPLCWGHGMLIHALEFEERERERIYVCFRMCVYVCMHLWKSWYNFSCPSSSTVLLFVEMGFSLTWTSASRSGLTLHQAQGSTCLHFPSIRMTSL